MKTGVCMKKIIFFVLMDITWIAIGALALVVPITKSLFDLILWDFVILFSIIGIIILSMK